MTSGANDRDEDFEDESEEGAPEPPPPGPNLFGEETPPPGSEPEPEPEPHAARESDAAAGGAPAPPASPAPAEKKSDAYRVLARKYRPTNFDELIGQEPLVRTLTNAIQAGRIAQAFVLTGVRGVGKTTTARIIAKALNCIGPDGDGGPTVKPCGVCEHCTAIASDRHVDVIEMDAASRTGVGDIRDLIDGVRYRPTSARYKVYILDEVHMLSTQAFNALLKTLEEPPEHVKFVFATTEIRKVPVTVLSRCQRFDLRRVPVEQLSAHFRRVAEAEGMGVDDEALAMIARAADGSVRDGLSILDQAIALSSERVAAERVRDMLGLADRARIYDLFDAAMKGDAPGSLQILEDLYDVGGDPAVVIQDLLDVTHWLTRAKLVPDLADRATTPELERTRGREMAATLGLPALARAWQMLMKGLSEVREAPSPIQAAEMVLIRLIHAADMPPPGELAKRLKAAGEGPAPAPGVGSSPASAPGTPASGPPASGTPGPGASASGATPAPTAGQVSDPAAPDRAASPQGAPSGESPRAAARGADAGVQTAAAVRPASPEPEAQPAPAPAGPLEPPPGDLRALAALADKRRELRMASALRRHVHPVAFERGRIEFRLSEAAPRDLKELPGRLARKLSEWTGERWMVSLSNAPGGPTLVEEDERAEQARLRRAEQDPLVQAVRAAFPGAEIARILAAEAERAAGDGQGLAALPSPDPDGGAPAPDDDAAYDEDAPFDHGPPPWEDGDPGPEDF
ncbi:MAG: DNA polymerase III subunit gamma/tau [Marivibrio sp.]|uniref:DNA polymerase III subunit gamma/tau n=1 Tax=Marivibrio sp. TaxID=2039719 RepID=UPI0032ED5C3B